MAINYSNFGTDFASTIGQVNSLSPKPNYDAADTISKAGQGGGLFGVTPQDISGQFDQNYDTAVGKYDPFPGDHSKIDQLQNLYGTVGDAYDVSGTMQQLDKTRGMNLLTGEQASNTAAQKFQEAQQPGQQNKTGAAMIRAQSLLGFTQADTTAAADQGKYADTAKQQALTAAAGIASTLASLEQDYTNSLASYNSGKAQFGLGYANDKTGMSLQASTVNTQSQLDLLKNQGQLAENARQANLAAALQQRNQDLNAAQTATNQRASAADAYLKNIKAPTGGWTTDNSGRVVSGQSDYDAQQKYLNSRGNAMGALANIAY